MKPRPCCFWRRGWSHATKPGSGFPWRTSRNCGGIRAQCHAILPVKLLPSDAFGNMRAAKMIARQKGVPSAAGFRPASRISYLPLPQPEVPAILETKQHDPSLKINNSDTGNRTPSHKAMPKMDMYVSMTYVCVRALAHENTIYISPSSRIMLPLYARLMPVCLG